MPLFTTPVANFQDAVGAALADSTLSFFIEGTTTPKNTFADPELTLVNPNPIESDGASDYPPIWLEPGSYDVELRDSAGVIRWRRSGVNRESVGLLDSTVLYFANIDDLKAGNTIGGQQVTLQLNQTVATQGYSASRDGGDETFVIVPGGTGPVDDIKFLQLDASPLLAQRLDPAPTNFPVVNAMSSALWLAVGDMAFTYGQLTVNDGNGSAYEIVPAGTGPADGLNFVNLANGNQARRLTLNVS